MKYLAATAELTGTTRTVEVVIAIFWTVIALILIPFAIDAYRHRGGRT